MRYYVNRNVQSNGDHVVHTSSCWSPPCGDEPDLPRRLHWVQRCRPDGQEPLSIVKRPLLLLLGLQHRLTSITMPRERMEAVHRADLVLFRQQCGPRFPMEQVR